MAGKAWISLLETLEITLLFSVLQYKTGFFNFSNEAIYSVNPDLLLTRENWQNSIWIQ
jgi:membrane protein CcdC involved in cytochrome C biogenesis